MGDARAFWISAIPHIIVTALLTMPLCWWLQGRFKNALGRPLLQVVGLWVIGYIEAFVFDFWFRGEFPARLLLAFLLCGLFMPYFTWFFTGGRRLHHSPKPKPAHVGIDTATASGAPVEVPRLLAGPRRPVKMPPRALPKVGGEQVASRGRRTAALTIDYLPVYLLHSCLASEYYVHEEANADLWLLLYAVVMGNSIIAQGLTGQSIGKFATRTSTMVIRNRRQFEYPGIGRMAVKVGIYYGLLAIASSFGFTYIQNGGYGLLLNQRVPTAIVLVFLGVLALWAFDKEHRSLFDRLIGVDVIGRPIRRGDVRFMPNDREWWKDEPGPPTTDAQRRMAKALGEVDGLWKSHRETMAAQAKQQSQDEGVEEIAHAIERRPAGGEREGEPVNVEQLKREEQPHVAPWQSRRRQPENWRSRLAEQLQAWACRLDPNRRDDP